MYTKIDISDFNPREEIGIITGTHDERKLKLNKYKEKYVQMILEVVGLKNHIYNILEDIEHHELDELREIIGDKCSSNFVKNQADLFIKNIEKNIESSKYTMKNHTPETFLKYFYGNKNIELEGEIRMNCINGAIVFEFENKNDYDNWTGHSNTKGLSYHQKNLIVVKGYNKKVFIEHELSHYYSYNLFAYNFNKKQKELYKQNYFIFDELLARSLKMNFSLKELNTDVIGKNSTYIQGRDFGYEMRKGTKNYNKIMELKEKHPKDFQKILLLTNLKRIDYFL